MTSKPRWGHFLAVAAAAAALTLGFLSLLLPLLLGALVLAGVILGALALRRPHPLCLVGGVAGVAAPLLLVAWLNRGGPGQRCAPGECVGLWDPWPWAAAGVVLLAAAGYGFARGRTLVGQTAVRARLYQSHHTTTNGSNSGT